MIAVHSSSSPWPVTRRRSAARRRGIPARVTWTPCSRPGARQETRVEFRRGAAPAERGGDSLDASVAPPSGRSGIRYLLIRSSNSVAEGSDSPLRRPCSGVLVERSTVVNGEPACSTIRHAPRRSPKPLGWTVEGNTGRRRRPARLTPRSLCTTAGSVRSPERASQRRARRATGRRSSRRDAAC